MPPERFDTLADWLAWQETLHPREMDFGLERCGQVAERLKLLRPDFPVISIAGTNGKGSCAAYLEGIYHAADYRVGCFTSPHLLRYNERLRLNRVEIADQPLCRLFAEVDRARGEISLTYFEFSALAAMLWFHQVGAEVAVLEVGLGGRLDAVNMFDADIALITALDIDHAQWLGTDRQQIALEKAGIFRSGHPAVCGDPDPPTSLARRAEELNVPLWVVGRDFHAELHGDAWDWLSGEAAWRDLPPPALAGSYQWRNAAAALQAAHLLRDRLPIPETAIHRGLREVRLPGRLQRLPLPFTCLLDVGHNPQAARELARELAAETPAGRTHALVAMMRDKDIDGSLRPLLEQIDSWHLAGLPLARCAEPALLAESLRRLGARDYHFHDSPQAAFRQLAEQLRPSDRLVIFGSFHTVEAVLREFDSAENGLLR